MIAGRTQFPLPWWIITPAAVAIGALMPILFQPAGGVRRVAFAACVLALVALGFAVARLVIVRVQQIRIDHAAHLAECQIHTEIWIDEEWKRINGT